MKPGQSAYTLLTNEQGGIIDDCIITKHKDFLYLVSNAACEEKDLKHLKQKMQEFGGDVELNKLENRGLIALQGPCAMQALGQIAPGADLSKMAFMTAQEFEVAGVPCHVARSGYTGEDGFEISIPGEHSEAVADALLQNATVRLSGLAARDSLRLEAGMCLYGHDLDDTTTPVEAALQWTIAKSRRASKGFLGADVICRQLKEGVERKRVGLLVEFAPARGSLYIFLTI